MDDLWVEVCIAVTIGQYEEESIVQRVSLL